MELNKLIALAQKTLVQIQENKSYQMNINQIKQNIPSTNSEFLLSLTLIHLIEENYEVTSLIAKLKVNSFN